jgi:ataxia telangiectasia mutated family protein
VSSIVGHVLGIGDRHCSNILVQQKTGEIVHIDFGIVFEQGRNLPRPEVVPFRLTQNIVDGLGPTGTDGPFRAAAETTLTVLRENAEALQAILTSIVADPLYIWTLSPDEARQIQDDEIEEEEDDGAAIVKKLTTVSNKVGSAEDQNEAAANAIAKVKEKLAGYEDGTGGEQQSVKSQIDYLINTACDEEKLSAMFVGWAPWS